MMPLTERRRKHLLLAAITLAGAALRVAELWMPLTHDELSAICRLHYSTFAELIEQGVCPDGHPAGMQALLWLWAKVVGTGSAWLLRLPFTMLGIACIPMFYSIAQRWYNPHAALLGAVGFAFAQYTVYYAMPIRPYGTGLFFTLLLIDAWTAICIGRRGSPARLIQFAFSTAMCAYMHYFCALTAALIALAGMAYVKGKERTCYTVACAVAVLLYAPHIGITWHHLTDLQGVGGWLGAPRPSFFYYYMRYLTHHSYLMLATGTGVIVATFSVDAFRKHKKQIATALGIGVLPLLVGYVYSVAVNPVLQYSVLIFGYPMLILALTGGVSLQKQRTVYIGATLCACMLVATLLFVRQHYNVLHREYIATTANAIHDAQQRYGDDNVALAVNVNPTMLAYYDSTMLAMPRFDAQDPGDIPVRDYIVCSRLLEPTVATLQHTYPYTVEQRYCTGTTIYLLSRKDTDCRPSEWAAEQKQCTVGGEYTVLLDVLATTLSRSRHFEIRCNATGNIANAHLVMETLIAGKRVDYRSSPLDNGHASIALCENLCIKSRLALRMARIKVYVWQPTPTAATHPIQYSIATQPCNKYIYSLTEEI